MAQQANVQRIGAYAWCLILTVAGGVLIVGALGGSPGEQPATVLVHEGTPPPITAADPDEELYAGAGAGISHVSNAE